MSQPRQRTVHAHDLDSPGEGNWSDASRTDTRHRALGSVHVPPPVKTASTPARQTAVVRPASGLRASRAPRVPFAVLVISLLVGGIALLLLLNTASAANELDRHGLATTDADVAAQVQQLQNEVAASAAPANLAREAQDLGMVPAGNPAFLVIAPDGAITVRGKASPVGPAPVAVAPVDKTKPKPAKTTHKTDKTKASDKPKTTTDKSKTTTSDKPKTSTTTATPKTATPKTATPKTATSKTATPKTAEPTTKHSNGGHR